MGKTNEGKIFPLSALPDHLSTSKTMDEIVPIVRDQIEEDVFAPRPPTRMDRVCSVKDIVHKKIAAALCLTTVKNEDKFDLSKILEATKDHIIRPLYEFDSNSLFNIYADIPIWVKHPDYNRIDWVNKFLSYMWPYLDKPYPDGGYTLSYSRPLPLRLQSASSSVSFLIVLLITAAADGDMGLFNSRGSSSLNQLFLQGVILTHNLCKGLASLSEMLKTTSLYCINEEQEKEMKHEFGQTCDWIKKLSGTFGWSANMESSDGLHERNKCFPSTQSSENLNAASQASPNDDDDALRALSESTVAAIYVLQLVDNLCFAQEWIK
ncbi:hypothetical protein ACFE04_027795 [Oxalis oulophora]